MAAELFPDYNDLVPGGQRRTRKASQANADGNLAPGKAADCAAGESGETDGHLTDARNAEGAEPARENFTRREVQAMEILAVNNLKKVYTTRFGGSQVQALSNVSFKVEEGEYVAIMGESGSGKTTLLNILAALDVPTGGAVLLDGRDLSRLRESERAQFRRDHLGFVFQEFNLLDTFSVQDNIFLPLVLAGTPYPEMEERLQPIARKLGIGDLLKKYPYEISGGQKQRVAVARALITKPRLILADEPTGALDSRATDELLRLFEAINRDGQTVLMVTHSVKAASHAGRVLFIKDGQVFHQIYRGADTDEQLYQKISDTLTMLATGGDRA